MALLDGIDRYSSGRPTTAPASAIDCSNCGETIFTNSVGEVTCDSCGTSVYAHNHRTEDCQAVECLDCNEPISFIKEHRGHIGGYETYHCHRCSSTIAFQTEQGPKQAEDVLVTPWILDGHSLDSTGHEFSGSYWAAEVRSNREQLAAGILNEAAREADSRFHPYIPNSTDAYLCLTEDHCIGYITWNWDRDDPELGQIYLLPDYRKQGIGSGFVNAWREDIAGPGALFFVNNPNETMYRVLRKIGALEVDEDGIDFIECNPTGSSFHLPDDWSPNAD